MEKIILNNETIELVDNDLEITIDGVCKLYIINKSYKLVINLSDNSKLDVYDFNVTNTNNSLVINQSNNTEFNYYHSFKIDGDKLLDIKAYINGNKNINKINIYGISNGYANILVDGIVKQGSKDNVLDENIKVLTIGGKCFTKPMMHINVKECIANHNTAISNVREDEIFYLMSKGITRDKAVELISDGYLYGLYKDHDFLEKIR